MDQLWKNRFNSVFKSLFSREPEGIFEIFILLLNALSPEKTFGSSRRMKTLLKDILAGVELADRLFIRYDTAIKPSINQKQIEKAEA